MEMEREGIYCARWGFVSESDNVIENLSLDGMSGSPKLTKLVTGKFLFPYEQPCSTQSLCFHRIVVYGLLWIKAWDLSLVNMHQPY